MSLNVKPILPVATKSNIVTQVLTYAVTPAGATAPHPSVTTNIDVSPTAAPDAIPTFVFNDGDSVLASVHQIDAKGNKSPESDSSTTVIVDNLIPPKPGVVGFEVISEKA